MASSVTALRVSSHGTTIAAAAAAAMATAAASSDFSNKASKKGSTVMLHPPTSFSQDSLGGSRSKEKAAFIPGESENVSRSRRNLKIGLVKDSLISGAWLSDLSVSRSTFLSHPHSFDSSIHGGGGGLKFSFTFKKPPIHSSIDFPFNKKLNGFNTFPIIPSGAPGSNIAPNSSKEMHYWYFPRPGSGSHGGETKPSSTSSSVTSVKEEEGATSVVLLGWLGSKQKHLKKYVEWYTGYGMHAVTFVLPMADIFSLQNGIGSKAEQHVDSLVAELERWLDLETDELGSSPKDKSGKKKFLVFHTFSNTGWLLYGAVLKRLTERHGVDVINSVIKGCVVDSAPVLDLKPRVWASGFAAALLKKQAQRSTEKESDPYVVASLEKNLGPSSAGFADIEGWAESRTADGTEQRKISGVESTVEKILESFFSVFLRLPTVKQKLSEITTVLEGLQPPCPQLYIYSSADTVIPAGDVESFAELQKRKGKIVWTQKFEGSPHVDHFRNFPEVYSKQLAKFMGACVPAQK